jgi:hypothetical protein
MLRPSQGFCNAVSQRLKMIGRQAVAVHRQKSGRIRNAVSQKSEQVAFSGAAQANHGDTFSGQRCFADGLNFIVPVIGRVGIPNGHKDPSLELFFTEECLNYT